jgi:4-amino-4-deoxy-L-arabinose transferase-like glycosyltransferase
MAPDTAALAPWAAMWRSDGFAFVLLATLALAFRFVVLVQTSRTPYFAVTNIDSGSYQKWAQELVANGWWPTRHFYQSPFYAYFLALIYRICGDGPWAPRVLQIVLGSLIPVFVYSLGTRLFSRRVGWIGGLLIAFYGPLVLEEVTLSKTSPLMVTAMAGMAAYLRYAPGAVLSGVALAGALFGLAVVGVAQWLLAFVVLAALLPWVAHAAPRRARQVALVGFVAAGVLTVGPVVLWNSAHGGGLVLTSGGAGLNLYSGNNERATGLPASPPGLRDIPEFEEEDARRIAEKDLGRELKPAEVDRYWSGRAFAYITSHPGAWLGLLMQKFTVLWNWFEIPDNYQFTFMRDVFLPALRPSVTLAVVGPLALLGVCLPLWRRRGVAVFVAVLAAYAVTPLLYYVRGRYRLPMAPFLAVLAGVAIERLLRAASARRWDHLAALGGALLATGVFVNHTHCEPTHHGLNALCFAGDIWYDLEWLKLANFHQDRGDLASALSAVQGAEACSTPRSAGQIIFWKGDVARRYGEALAVSGDRAGAAVQWQASAAAFRRAVQIKYRTDAAAHNLSLVEAKLADTP